MKIRLLFYFLISTLLPLTVSGGKRQMEHLDRGLVAVKTGSGVFLSWRLLASDDPGVQFELYKNNVLLTKTGETDATNYTDAQGQNSDKYLVRTVLNGEALDESKPCTPWGQQYLSIQLNRPAAGITPANVTHDGTSSGTAVNYPNGEEYTYTPNDMSTADLDGDGEYELIVKWDPSNSKDNSQTGITGEVFMDAYKLDGTQLWRISLGKNIRAGAHYTQFMVYDLDGDGVAEVVCKTAPGTIDGLGNYVIMGSDNPQADYRNLNISTSGNTRTGFILNGPEYLTLFDGKTGKELHTIAYKPGRSGSWGDNYGNRVDRFLACVAYLDGERPSVVMCRGYYTRATLTAYDVVNKRLVERWFYDSGTSASASNAYGQGNHNLAVGDLDGDGFDEIVYGGAAIDRNGKLLYNTRLGHGDAGHLSDMDPDREGLEWFQPHEEKTAAYGHEFRDAGAGTIIWGEYTGTDNGRGLAADIDPNHRGFELWSSSVSGTYNCKGVKISDKKPGSTNFRIYWDGDLQDELLDKNVISKWDPSGNKTNTLLTMAGCSSNNSTKATPNLSADLLGDWREEVILYETSNPGKIRIYTTTIPTQHRLYTLMHDPVYRLSIAWQNVAYNQPPHLGFYIGDGTNNISRPDIYTPEYGSTGVESPKSDVTCRIYLNGKGILHVVSGDLIRSVCVYDINGRLLKQKNNINLDFFSGCTSFHSNELYLVKVVTERGVVIRKVMY